MGSPLAHRGSRLIKSRWSHSSGSPFHLPGVAGRLCSCPVCDRPLDLPGSCIWSCIRMWQHQPLSWGLLQPGLQGTLLPKCPDSPLGFVVGEQVVLRAHLGWELQLLCSSAQGPPSWANPLRFQPLLWPRFHYTNVVLTTFGGLCGFTVFPGLSPAQPPWREETGGTSGPCPALLSV